MAKSTNPATKKTDQDLVAKAIAFADAFAASHKRDSTYSQFKPGSGISMGSAGVVEIDVDIAVSLDEFIIRAEKLLGHNAAHSRAIYDTALHAAHQAVNDGLTGKQAATATIDAVWTQALTSYEWIAPNRLFRFDNAVDEIKIGRVRAIKTPVIQNERAKQYPDQKVVIEISGNKGFRLNSDGTAVLYLHGTCWYVQVDAVKEHVETEGKWLIDVAISYLRLRHPNWGGLYPDTGDKEPHPTAEFSHMNEGAKIQASTILAGGGKAPSWYAIDPTVLATTTSQKFTADADVIFSPPPKSLAERVSQGLGWLTRGRQTDDRAERLLYFFTAIEALLSNDDKTAPVTQTIARHAAVMLTNDNHNRSEIAAEIKALYAFRSALVHAGSRSVSGSVANRTQDIAEALYMTALEKADLKSSHETFNNSLAKASYGSTWP